MVRPAILFFSFRIRHRHSSTGVMWFDCSSYQHANIFYTNRQQLQTTITQSKGRKMETIEDIPSICKSCHHICVCTTIISFSPTHHLLTTLLSWMTHSGKISVSYRMTGCGVRVLEKNVRFNNNFKFHYKPLDTSVLAILCYI